MGLIKAAIGAIGGTLADQWKEYFTCDSIDVDTLVVSGFKKTSGRSSNTKGSDNIITDGSKIVVADGQCAIIVESGRVIEVCAEPGEYTYDNKVAPSLFGSGDLMDNVKATFSTALNRLTFGGEASGDQRIYYFNMKELMGNKYGTASPVPFRVVDTNIGLDIDISIRCNGEYSYRITNPILFYSNVCGNISGEYNRSQIDSMLKSELLTALQPAFAKISTMGIRYSALPGHTTEIAATLNEVLSEKWRNLRGLEIASFGVNSVTAPKEDEDMIKQLQRTAVMRNPGMAAATLTSAQADAMRDAANNSGGAMMGFAGINMAQGAGGMNAQNLYNMAAQQPQQQPAPQAAPPADGWTCACGNANTGKFCNICGKQKPAPAGTWACGCGTSNSGKFCNNCGKQKPAEEGSWACSCGANNTGKFCSNCGKPSANFKCDKCGWEPKDKANPPKFCPECGDPFTDEDRV